MDQGESVAQFSVNLTCQSCVEKTEKVLTGVPGINKFQVDLARQSVVVTSTLPSETIKSLIESTGKQAVVTGSGGLLGSLGAAVAAIGGTMGIGAKVQGKNRALNQVAGWFPKELNDRLLVRMKE